MAKMMNDVTTSFDKPPRFSDPKRDADYPESFKAMQKQLYPDIAPLKVSAPPADVFRKVREAAKAMPDWRIVSEDASKHSIQVVAITKWMRFRDDVSIEVRPASGGSEVHMRSKSRLGRDEFGANANRIREFFAKLK